MLNAVIVGTINVRTGRKILPLARLPVKSGLLPRNMTGLQMLFTEKNKCKAGAVPKREALIKGDIRKLPALAKKKFVFEKEILE